VLICQDGDKPGTPASRDIIAATDHFLAIGCRVKVTKPAEGSDNNDYLARGGIEALRALLEAAEAPAGPSMHGAVKQLASIRDPLLRDQRRAEIKKDHKVSIGSIRAMERLADVEREREAERIERDAKLSVPAWEGAIDGDKALNEIFEVLKAWIVAPDCLLRLACIWLASVHLHRNPRMEFSTATNLKIEAGDEDSGKTTLMQLLGLFCTPFSTPPLTHYTPASLRRIFVDASAVGAPKPLLLLDELQHNNTRGDIVEFITGCTRKGTRADLLVDRGERKWEREQIDLFGPVLLAGIGSDPAEVASRNIVLPLQKVSIDALADREAPTDAAPEMLRMTAHLKAWANQHRGEIKYPKRPAWIPSQLATRQARHWLLLLKIATVIGGGWAAHVEDAGRMLLNQIKELPVQHRLLVSIMKAFDNPERLKALNEANNGKEASEVENLDQMLKATMLHLLLNDAEEDWHHEGPGGRRINHRWLNMHLRDWFKVEFEWLVDGPVENRRRHRVYRRSQFIPLCRSRLPKWLWEDQEAEDGKTVFRFKEEGRPDSPFSPTSTPLCSDTADTEGAEGGVDVSLVSVVSEHKGVEVEENKITEHPPDSIDAGILALKAANPKWGVDRIRKELGQPRSRVRKALGLPE
jgi:hypothetical protein